MELKPLLLSSVKSNVDKSKSIGLGFGGCITFDVLSLKVLLQPSDEILLERRRSSGSDEVGERILPSSWESVDSVDCLRNKLSILGLVSFPCESFLRLRALNPMSSKMSYFSNPPQRAAK